MSQIHGPPGTSEGGALVPAPLTTVTAISAFRAPLLDLDVLPSLVAGRRARYTAVIVNRSGHEVQARLSITAGDAGLRADVSPSTLVLGPGQAAHAVVSLRPRRPQLLRRERQRTARVRVHAPDGSVAAARQVIFVQQRLVPPWVWPARPRRCWPPPRSRVTRIPERVTVPAVEGATDVATAEARAARRRPAPRPAAALAHDDRRAAGDDPRPDPRAGHAAEQRRAGLAARRGQRHARGDARARRPDAGARRRAPARGGPRRGAGPARAGASPAAVVASQLPAAGSRVPAGTAVTMFVEHARRRAPRPRREPSRSRSSSGRPVTVPGRSTAATSRSTRGPSPPPGSSRTSSARSTRGRRARSSACARAPGSTLAAGDGRADPRRRRRPAARLRLGRRAARLRPARWAAR